MKVWTDYPFRENDLPRFSQRQLAPIRKVRVISWDGNKYVRVRWRREVVEIKYGYLYAVPARCGDVPHVNFNLYKVHDE